MGSVLKNIFGGSDSSHRSASFVQDVTPQEFRELRGPFADILKGLFSGGQSDPLGGVPSYSGQTVAGMTGTESDLLASLIGEGGDRSNYLNAVLGGDYLDPSSNPFLNDYISAATRPILEGLTETLDRALPGRFTAAGQFVQPESSSAFDRAAALASRGAANAIGDVGTNIATAAYEGERGRQQQAVQLSQADLQGMLQKFQAAALPRLIEQAGLDKGLEIFNTQINTLLQALGVLTQTPVSQQGTFSTASGSADSRTGIIPAIGSLI